MNPDDIRIPVKGASQPRAPDAGALTPALLEAPINILIVDDEPRNLTVLETLLDDPDYRLVRATSADQALLALVAEEFALLIFDIRMPVMTGFELAQTIKARKKTAQVPIIFLTAYYNDDQHVLAGYGTGAVDFLHKPVNPVILRSKVAIFAELHRKSRELALANRALVSEIAERSKAQAELRELNETLEQRIVERTNALIERTQIEEAAREQLRASEEFNRSLMDGTSDGVKVLGLDGRILHMNRAALSQLEIEDFEALRGRDWTSLWPEESHEIVRFAIEHARTGEPAAFTAGRPNAAGAQRWWNVSVSAVREPLTGVVARLLAVSRDVTEARQAERALRESDAKKDNFIATLAHELRNPLAPIRNAVNVMRHKETTDSELVWCRDVIDRQVGQMSHLLDGLLDVSRITRSQLTLRREMIDLATVIELALEIARPFIDEAGHSLVVKLAQHPMVVNGDLTRLAQVVSNLLINAAKYSSTNGNIALSAQQEADEIVVKVKDNGIGIESDQLLHVFEMFTQVQSALKHSQGGLGIGLSLAKGLVEMHSGQLNGYSEGLGKGSEFVMRLPVGRGMKLGQPSESGTHAHASATEKFRILVADDLRDSADSLAMLLQAMGHDVRTTYEGEQAVRIAGEFRPDVAFIDIGMPIVNGYEVCRTIRDQAWGARMVLIAQTGWGRDDDRRRTLEAGFDYHMTKPLDPNAVVALLSNLATRSGALSSET